MRLRLPRVIRRKITAPYQAVKYTLMVVAAFLLLFLTGAPSAG